MGSADDRFGFALFGTGRIGTIHFPNVFLNERTRLLWVVEEDTKRAEGLVRRYGGQHTIKVVNNAESAQVFNDPLVRAVMVCTPSFTHEHIVRQALEAGKAVFCEKPLATTLEAVKASYKLAAHHRQPLFCAFNRRYDPQIRQVKNMVHSGAVGTVRMVKSCSRDPPGMLTKEYLRNSGGIFIDSAVHDIDLLCWLVGERPYSVYATGHAMQPMFAECDDVDTCALVLKFPGGAIGMIEVSRQAPIGYDQRVEVFGSDGLVQSENKRHKDVLQWSMEGVKAQPIYDDCCQRYSEAYKVELEHFLNVLQGKEEMEVDRDSVVGVNQIALACKQSLQTSAVIDLKYE